jgi:hypothetical protein
MLFFVKGYFPIFFFSFYFPQISPQIPQIFKNSPPISPQIIQSADYADISADDTDIIEKDVRRKLKGRQSFAEGLSPNDCVGVSRQIFFPHGNRNLNPARGVMCITVGEAQRNLRIGSPNIIKSRRDGISPARRNAAG